MGLFEQIQARGKLDQVIHDLYEVERHLSNIKDRVHVGQAILLLEKVTEENERF